MATASMMVKSIRNETETGRIWTRQYPSIGCLFTSRSLKALVQYKTGVSFFGMCAIGSVPFVKNGYSMETKSRTWYVVLPHRKQSRQKCTNFGLKRQRTLPPSQIQRDRWNSSSNGAKDYQITPLNTTVNLILCYRIRNHHPLLVCWRLRMAILRVDWTNS